MRHNKAPNLNKINQIILLSQNYSAHKKMVSQAKSSVDVSSPRRDDYNKQLLNQYSKRAHAALHVKDNQLNQSNRKICEKLQKFIKPVSKEKIIEQSLKSVTARSSWYLKNSKQRQRSRYEKLIDFENKKMSERISKSRSKQNFGRQSYLKQKNQTTRDLNIRSEYSQRSQSVLENLLYNDLKICSKDIPFLPQLSNRQREKSNKNGKSMMLNKRQRPTKTNFNQKQISFQKETSFKF